MLSDVRRVLLSAILHIHFAVAIASRSYDRRILHASLILHIDAAPACVRRHDGADLMAVPHGQAAYASLAALLALILRLPRLNTCDTLRKP